MTRDEVFAVVRDAVVTVLGVEPSAVTRTSSFGPDLRADRLARVEIAEIVGMQVSARVGAPLELDDADVDGFATVDDAVEHVLDGIAGGDRGRVSG